MVGLVGRKDCREYKGNTVGMYGTTERGVNMCTRFVCNGTDTVVGFNFVIDLSVWAHTVIIEKDRFFIGIKMPDNKYRSFRKKGEKRECRTRRNHVEILVYSCNYVLSMNGILLVKRSR